MHNVRTHLTPFRHIARPAFIHQSCLPAHNQQELLTPVVLLRINCRLYHLRFRAHTIYEFLTAKFETHNRWPRTPCFGPPNGCLTLKWWRWLPEMAVGQQSTPASTGCLPLTALMISWYQIPMLTPCSSDCQTAFTASGQSRRCRCSNSFKKLIDIFG